MHLIIQIPCYNEEKTLPQTLADLPRSLPGIDRLEVLIIDDGSSDDTAVVAERLGVDYIVQHPANRGIAAAFHSGLTACLHLGADIIVNTDADNQYPGQAIERLVEPILHGQADMVIGNRQTGTIRHFSPLKRFLQQFGSWVVRLASGTEIPDATSGFRAFTRDAAMQLNTFNNYTYTLDTIIQAGKKGLSMTSIPISVNPPLRESRLIKSNWDYVKRNAFTILRLYTFYEPLRTFSYISLPFMLIGLLLLLRFAYFHFFGDIQEPGRYVQSVVIGSTMLILGFLILILGILADLSAANRRLTEEVLYSLKSLNYNSSESLTRYAFNLKVLREDAPRPGCEAPPEKVPQG